MTLNKKWPNPPVMAIDHKKDYTAIMHTDKGDITIQLFADTAPITVNNFVFLASQGFYDGTIFHRVITSFMAQGGDPTATGRGGPGYHFKDEFHPKLRHDKPGVLSMANSGANTNGSQFFLTHVATPWLDNKHSVFGQVTAGLDVLLSIPARDPNQINAPAVRLTNITINEV
jgi:cyclophilin family peptidyl-prolyl cis-trans isomerase